MVVDAAWPNQFEFKRIDVKSQLFSWNSLPFSGYSEIYAFYYITTADWSNEQKKMSDKIADFSSK